MLKSCEKVGRGFYDTELRSLQLHSRAQIQFIHFCGRDAGRNTMQHIFFTYVALWDDGIRIDMLNPSGQACNSFASCQGKLFASDGTPVEPAPSWDPAITFNILEGDFCIELSSSLVFRGLDCKGQWKKVMCQYNCNPGRITRPTISQF